MTQSWEVFSVESIHVAASIVLLEVIERVLHSLSRVTNRENFANERDVVSIIELNGFICL